MKPLWKLDGRIFVTALVSTLLISYAVAYESTQGPRQLDIFQLYVLGTHGTLSNYFPSGKSTVMPNSAINWSLGVINNMATSEYVTIEVKLGNQTTTGPVATASASSPSTLPVFVQFSQVIASKFTWLIPFHWVVQNVSSSAGSRTSLSLIINGEALGSGNITATNGVNFRFIFELWKVDPSTGNMIFGWKGSSGQDATWTQLWFNATAT